MERGDTRYHTVVTVFEPDTMRNGMEYDYAEELLSNSDNIQLEIVRGQSARSATGEKHPNTSSKLPSEAILAQDVDGVKKFAENSDNVNSKFSLGYHAGKVKGEDGVKVSLSESGDIISLNDVEALRTIERKSINAFSSEEIQKAEPWARKFWRELGTKSPFFRAWFGDWRAYDNTAISKVSRAGDARGTIINEDTQWDIIVSRQVHKETTHQSSASVKNAVKYLPYINDITKNAVLLDSAVSDSGNELSVMFHSMYAYTEVMGYPALLKLRVEELINEKSGEPIRRDYILQSIKEEPISERNRFSTPNRNETNSSISSVSDLFNLVKTYDKEFSPKPVNKVLLNADGTPKACISSRRKPCISSTRSVVYHHCEARYTLARDEIQPQRG